MHLVAYKRAVIVRGEALKKQVQGVAPIISFLLLLQFRIAVS